jgi:hypothetical protein
MEASSRRADLAKDDLTPAVAEPGNASGEQRSQIFVVR